MIPFGTLIGAPLNAAIEAQAKAAMTSVDFIRAVGFKPAQDNQPLEPANIVFKYKNGPAASDMMTLEVPLLTIVPIPFLRIEKWSSPLPIRL